MPTTNQFIIFLFINVFLHFSVLANNQDYRYTKSIYMEHFSLVDGLSQNTASDIIQDSEGYIWIATDGGLNRFDSDEFKVFRNNHNDSSSLHENGTITLLEESGVGIWIGTISGPSFYEFSTGKFINYSKSILKIKTKIFGFAHASNNIVWMASENGLFYLDRKNETNFQRFRSLDGLEISEQVMSLSISNNHLFVSVGECI